MDAQKRRDGRSVDPDHIELAAEILALLAEPTRIRIILALDAEGELAVGDLASAVDRPRAGVSQHLARLRMARLVTTRQLGTKVMYQLADEHAVAIIVEAARQAEHSVTLGSEVPRHHSAPQ